MNERRVTNRKYRSMQGGLVVLGEGRSEDDRQSLGVASYRARWESGRERRGDSVNAFEHRLDVMREVVHAVDDDAVFAPPREGQTTTDEQAAIAGSEPTVIGERVRRCRGVVVVALENHWTAHLKLTDRPLRNLDILLIHDAKRETSD